MLDIAYYADIAAGLANSIALLLLLKVFRPGPLLAAPPRRGRVSLLSAFGVLALYMGLAIMTTPFLVMFHAGPASGPQTLRQTVIQQGTDSAVRLLVCVFIIWMMRRAMTGGLQAWGLAIRDLPRGLKSGIAAVATLYPLLLVADVALEIVLEHFGTHIVPHQTFGLLQERPAWWEQAVLLGSAAIVAPISEEFFFRGILQTALVQKGWGLWWDLPRWTVRGFEVLGPDYPRDSGEIVATRGPTPAHRWAAILLTAALFAAIHFSPTNFPILFLLGVGLGYLYERTGNLWAAITLHALFNIANLSEFYLTGGA